MPIEQAPIAPAPPPQEMLDIILVAQAKVTVLKEEQLRLESDRDKAYKQNARLELQTTELEAEVASLLAKREEAERNARSAAEMLERALAELDAATQTRRSLEKESIEIRARIAAESAALSETVTRRREASEAVGIEAEAHRAAVAAFEERKARVRELISSI